MTALSAEFREQQRTHQNRCCSVRKTEILSTLKPVKFWNRQKNKQFLAWMSICRGGPIPTAPALEIKMNEEQKSNQFEITALGSDMNEKINISDVLAICHFKNSTQGDFTRIFLLPSGIVDATGIINDPSLKHKTVKCECGYCRFYVAGTRGYCILTGTPALKGFKKGIEYLHKNENEGCIQPHKFFSPKKLSSEERL